MLLYCERGFLMFFPSLSPSSSYPHSTSCADNKQKLTGQSYLFSCLIFFLCGLNFPCCFSEGRAALRSKYNLPDTPAPDCCLYLLCFPCALCQEDRELAARGVHAFVPGGGPTVVVVQQAPGQVGYGV